MPNSPFDTRLGWQLYIYPTFKVPYDALVAAVGRLAADSPDEYATHPKTKLLARINSLILEEIPSDPGHPMYRQGTTLGPQYRAWFRAKFLGRFRLFFRYDAKARIIIYCWVNDENTLRKSGSETDPYSVFARMIRSGCPPNDWTDLVTQVVGQPDA
jgi:toxin YhaV